jgi:histidinol-phosphatase
MAALDLIVTEAGGCFTNTSGVPGPHGGNGVSTNAALHRYVIEALNKEI